MAKLEQDAQESVAALATIRQNKSALQAQVAALENELADVSAKVQRFQQDVTTMTEKGEALAIQVSNCGRCFFFLEKCRSILLKSLPFPFPLFDYFMQLKDLRKRRASAVQDEAAKKRLENELDKLSKNLAKAVAAASVVENKIAEAQQALDNVGGVMLKAQKAKVGWK